MKEFIPLIKPNINENDIEQVANVLRSGVLVQGKFVNELENSFSKLADTKATSALSNGTATLHLALIALGIKAGDEVIVPAFSYVATANVVELVGARPIFVDIEPDTFNIDPSKIESAISERTKAIIVVHEFGLSCDLDKIMSISSKYNLPVIEDAACAMGAKYRDRHVGTFGVFGSFSLHPRKAISSGEGGLLVTNDPQLDKKIKILRNHGIELKDGEFEFTEFGYNYRMTDFQAALVCSQLPRLQSSIDYKNQLASIYLEELDTARIKLPVTPDFTRHTWQTFHIIISPEIDRNRVIQELKDNQIGSNYGAQCIPFVEVYRKKYALDCEGLFPNAMRAFKHGLALPLYDLMTADQVKYVIQKINKIVNDNQ